MSPNQRMTLSVVMLTAGLGAVAAAPAPAGGDKAEADARLDAVLEAWAKASDARTEAHFTFRQKVVEKDLDRTQITRGELFVRRADLLRIDLKGKSGALAPTFFYKDRTVHLFSAADQTEGLYHLSPDYGFPEQPDRYPGGFMASIGGALLEQTTWVAGIHPIRDLKSRYDVRLTKEDDNFIYLVLKPRKEADRWDFQRMQIVLGRKTFRVVRLWLERPNDDETTYEFDPPGDSSTEAVTPESIMKGLPKDYKKVGP